MGEAGCAADPCGGPSLRGVPEYFLFSSNPCLAYRPTVKGPVHSKNENLYFLASAQTKRMQPILVSCEAPIGAI